MGSNPTSSEKKYAMKCPFCGTGDSKVTDSRSVADANATRRRRECLACGRRFTTFETIDLTIQVKKRDGQYQDFQIDKLIRGLEASCRHTRISHDRVVALASDVMQEILEQQIREIPSLEIGEIIMKKLKKLDPVAYVRFACVYRRFKDPNELVHVIDDVVDRG